MSLQARVCHCLSEKNIFLVLVGKTTLSTPRWQNIYFPSFSRILSPFHDAKFSILFFYISSLFAHSGPSLHRNFLQSHADSWFVYQNIDLFSLYTFTLALLLVHFFSFSPLPKAPLTGHPLLVIDLPAKQSLAARGTRGRQGSIHLGILVPNWQCRHLCWGGERLSDWSLFKMRTQNFQLMDSFMWREKCSCDWNVLFVVITCNRQANIPPYWRKTIVSRTFVLPPLFSRFAPHDRALCQSDMGKILSIQMCTWGWDSSGSYRSILEEWLYETEATARMRASTNPILNVLLIYCTLQKVIKQVHATGPLVSKFGMLGKPMAVHER